jgi:hypothetical protein
VLSVAEPGLTGEESIVGDSCFQSIDDARSSSLSVAIRLLAVHGDYFFMIDSFMLLLSNSQV